MGHISSAHAHVAALAALDRMTTARLHALLAGRTPEHAFAIAAGEQPATSTIAALLAAEPELRRRWVASARSARPERLAARCDELGVRVLLPGDDGFPAQLLDDPRRPAFVFAQGDLRAVEGRRVGIVGTRNPTRAGAQTAARFGHDLAAAGVAIVSGLALGVDGAAHRGALDAGGVAVGVVANGHGDPYPRRHAELWRRVADNGVVLSEWPPGTRPEAFRFPQRNRIIAALSEVLVVVESRERGGSLITATQAAERGVEVLAVPGPVDGRASSGTNALLEDGAHPACSPESVLVALGLDGRRSGRRRYDARRRPTGAEAEVLALCRRGPRTLDHVVEATSMTLAEAAMTLARLESAGWLVATAGWFEAVDEFGDLA